MPYNNAVPKATDRISDTQLPIKNNFAAIETVVSVNHVKFDDASGNQGKHKWASFPEQVAAPSTAANEMAIYSMFSTLSAQTELFVRKEGDTASYEFTSSLAGNEGWTRLPSGILLKWASGNITNASGITTFSWAVAATIPVFSSVFDVHVTTNNSVAVATDKIVTMTGLSTTTVSLYGTRRITNAALAVNYNVFAIGI